MLRRLLGEDVEMVFRPGESLRRVRVDQGQVEQILMNLAANARDAMPMGGRLVVETRNAGPDDPAGGAESGAVPGPWVVLTVSDNGVGMDEETKAHAFEPFYTTKEVGKGTGLGLSTVYGIVAQSGGSVSVESAPGRGATFRICLPAPDGEPGPAVDAPPAVSPGGRETVLLVEDEGQVRRLLREILAAAGYGVIEARDGEQALSLAAGRPGRIHLLLTDVVMPGISGKELYDALSAARPGILVLFISGFIGHASVDDGVLGAGAVLLQKPFLPEELLAKVRGVLDAGG
jgi:CheY-like chemotaxis protein